MFLLVSVLCPIPQLFARLVDDFPAFPPEDVTNVMDMQQMAAQLGVTFPYLLEHREDPNRPDHVVPTDSSYKYWTDVEGYAPNSPANYHVKRSQWGEWTNFTEDPARLGNYSPLDPLKYKNGKAVKNVRSWENKRSKEIFELCQREVWGVIPKEAGNLKVVWTEDSNTNDVWRMLDEPSNGKSNFVQRLGEKIKGRKSSDIPYRIVQMTGSVDTSFYPEIRHQPKIAVRLYQPAVSKPTPVIIQLCSSLASEPDPVVLEELFVRGWGYMLFDCTQLQPDNGKYMTDYLVGLLNKGNWRKPEDWGAMVAWSWGISRIIDHCTAIKSIDEKKIGVTGHSRYGKTSLVAMVYEPRLAIAYVSCSGCLGAAPMRTNYGENLEVMASEGSYFWASGNIFKWVGLEKANRTTLRQENYQMPRKREEMPVDAHFLLALVAPRPIFINAGTTDYWANPMGMYCTCRDASPVYHLYGLSGLVMQDRAPIPDKEYIDGEIGFRLHTGGHTDRLDWPTFITFAEKYF